MPRSQMSNSANFDTGTLTVAITAGGTAAEDVLSVQNVGTADGQISVSGSTISYNPVGAGTIASIGTFTGGTGGSALVITLDSDATPVAVQALMRALQYSNSNNNNPSGTARTVTVTLTDGDGGTSNVSTTTVNVTGVNDAPVVANLNGDSATFTEGGAAVALDQGGNATVTDVDFANFSTGTLTVAITAGGTSAEDVLSIGTIGLITTGAGTVSFSGTQIGTFTGGTGGTNLVNHARSRRHPGGCAGADARSAIQQLEQQ